MVYDEYLTNKHAKDYIKENDFHEVLLILENKDNEDLAIVFENNVNMITLFRGLAKAFLIMSKFTKKPVKDLVTTLEKAIELEDKLK